MRLIINNRFQSKNWISSFKY